MDSTGQSAIASQKAAPAGDGPWRDGKYLVFRSSSPMPLRCNRCCSKLAAIQELKLRWQPKPSVHFSSIIAAAEMILRTENIVVKVGRCPSCTPFISARSLGNILGILAVIMLVGMLPAYTVTGKESSLLWWGSIGVGAAILAIICAVWPTDVRIVYLQDGYIWVSGCSREFLSPLCDYASVGPDRPRRESSGTCTR